MKIRFCQLSLFNVIITVNVSVDLSFTQDYPSTMIWSDDTVKSQKNRIVLH